MLAVSGTLLGLGWSVLGLYLSSLVFQTNSPAAYAIKGLFLSTAVMVHGFLRSYAPRLFLFVLQLITPCMVTMLSTQNRVTSTSVVQILYPDLIAIGVILLVNLCFYPEFSSSFLGQVTMETLDAIAVALENSGDYLTQTREQTTEGEEAEPRAMENNRELNITGSETLGKEIRMTASDPQDHRNTDCAGTGTQPLGGKRCINC